MLDTAAVVTQQLTEARATVGNFVPGVTMRLTFVGKDPNSNPTGSPTIYRTDRNSWVVQGWIVTDDAALRQLNIPDGETCVEIPDRVVGFFRGEQ